MKLPLLRKGETHLDLITRTQQDRIHTERKIARIVQEAGINTEITTQTGATLPGDSRRLRGIPAIGRGVTGAINNTRPGDTIR